MRKYAFVYTLEVLYALERYRYFQGEVSARDMCEAIKKVYDGIKDFLDVTSDFSWIVKSFNIIEIQGVNDENG